MSQSLSRREWLLTEQPGSCRQARLGQFYRTWLALRSNPLAMVGLGIIVALILVALFANVIAPYDPLVGGDLRTERLLPPPPPIGSAPTIRRATSSAGSYMARG